ncbi:conserved hypothetical protein [uncultured Desulfobacterium sp.]|uniref:Tyrosine specific protein phosphatases domain-containing protein n=1 Tax=uncultured Desulfobacterium sp. TaxID=201089 RepID=A0A445MUA7_9BACT|nr:conserved hypothetical protein [uncultured Desulfobacterium sp.]
MQNIVKFDIGEERFSWDGDKYSQRKAWVSGLHSSQLWRPNIFSNHAFHKDFACEGGVINMMAQPIKYCYWVAPGKLLAGEYPRNKDEQSSEEKLRALLRAGVTAFIDLTEEHEGLQPYSALIGAASHHRFPIRDVSIPESPDATIAILNAIDRNIERGQLVYVHCWGGVGRTGVIIGCWLARHGRGGEAALSHLRELWRQCPKSVDRESPETREQELYILKWEAGR